MKSVLIAVLCLSVAPLAALAQDVALPQLFDVKDVKADDKLNIRSEASAKADVISAIEPDARDIEVIQLSPDQKWGLVNAGESSGWVSMQHLTANDDTWQNGKLPSNLLCSGTEPFWSLAHKDGKLVYSTPDSEEATYDIAAILNRNFDGERNRAIVASSGDNKITAVVQPGQCSDGMSDRSFGLNATVVFQKGNADPSMQIGCCSLAR